jgi:RHS repeat-associated protein
VPVWANTTDHSHKLGLKVASHFWEVVNGDWSLDRSETYEYDDQTDWLVEVDYNDGLSNEVTTWTYDAAGNRASDSSISGSWTYDNLNRMTASPYGTYTNDLLGNRTGLDTSGDDPEYSWDELNRMVAYFPDGDPGDETRYAYRADGMRVHKAEAYSTHNANTDYFYDGQMGVMDVEVYDPASGPDVTTVTKYGIGARGIDLITKKVDSGSESFGYPIYDTHGNMVATLARYGSNSYSTGNAQTYDVWGGVRSGSSTEDQGYVANLGHRKDSESDLQYMRARYYDPSTGRFVSEDRAKDRSNWYAYCGNAPSTFVDESGNTYGWQLFLLSTIIAGLAVAVKHGSTVARILAIGASVFLGVWVFGNFLSDVLHDDFAPPPDMTSEADKRMMAVFVASLVALMSLAVASTFDMDPTKWTHGPLADVLEAYAVYGALIGAILILLELGIY